MSDLRKEMMEIGIQHDPVRESLRRMIAEFSENHYNTCPASDGDGECDCFAGSIVAGAARVFLRNKP
jgi:hypothetical protein